MIMSVKYLSSDGTVQTFTGVTKIEPIKNGTRLLLTGATDLVIKFSDLIEVTNS